MNSVLEVAFRIFLTAKSDMYKPFTFLFGAKFIIKSEKIDVSEMNFSEKLSRRVFQNAEEN